MIVDFSADENALLEALGIVRSRPGMILGGASFERLHGFIVGFLLARGWPGGGERAVIDRFQHWLHANAAVAEWAPWYRIIQCLSCDDRDAFETFFQKFDAFMQDPSLP
jgi:hypothetical protein